MSDPTRLDVLRSLDLLDTAREQSFDDLAALAARICDAPVALVSLVESDRQWFKSKVGLDLDETPLNMSICAHAIQAGDFLEVEDTTRDARTLNNPLVTVDEGVRFYAGAVLRTGDGHALGTLCVLDHHPRALTASQRDSLQMLARLVMRQIELRKAQQNEELLKTEIDHRVKNSLQMVASMLRLQKSQSSCDETKQALAAAELRVEAISRVHKALSDTNSQVSLEMREYVESLTPLITSTLPGNVQVRSDVARLKMCSRKASALALIISEFSANAARHAFANRDVPGEIRITGTQISNDQYRLTLADNGVGMPDVRGGGAGLGMGIIAALAEQVGGRHAFSSADPGTMLTLVFDVNDARAEAA